MQKNGLFVQALNIISFRQYNLLFLRVRVLSVKYGDVTDHARQMASCSALKGPGYLCFLLFFFIIDKFDFN